VPGPINNVAVVGALFNDETYPKSGFEFEEE